MMVQKLRSGIQSKILTLFFTLIFLMVLVAGFSTLRTKNVNDELQDLTTVYYPLDHMVETCDMHVLEQELHLNRIINAYETKFPGWDGIAKTELEEYHQRSGIVRSELERAGQLIQDQLALDNSEQGIMALARMQVMLGNVEREFQNYEKHSFEILEQLKSGKIDEARLLEKHFIQEEDEFDRHIDSLREEIQNLSEGASRNAEKHEAMVIWLNAFTTILASLIAIMAAYVVTKRILQPIKNLMHGTRSLGEGDLEVQIPVTSSDELGALTESFNHMVSEIRIKEKIKSTFGQYVDPRIVEGLIDENGSPLSDGEKREMTVFFSDIAGFTPISERLTPSNLVNLMNAYLSEMSEAIRENNGVIDKYIGDAIMAFWGPPFTGEQEHASLACRAALLQKSILPGFNKKLPELLGLRKDLPRVDFRVGIHTGEVVVGNMGSEFSRNFTVMGDTVNLASRLESVNKIYGTNIIVSRNVLELCESDFVFRKLDLITVKGKEEPVFIYELIGTNETVSDEIKEWVGSYEKSLQFYFDRNWNDAKSGFKKTLEYNKNDSASLLLYKRVLLLHDQPPAEDWNGVFRMTSK